MIKAVQNFTRNRYDLKTGPERSGRAKRLKLAVLYIVEAIYKL